MQLGTQSNGGSRHRQDRSAYFRTDLNKWMEERGVTVYMLAKLSGVTRETIQTYVVQGKLPTSGTLHKIMAVLDVPQSKWAKYDTGGKLILPSGTVLWQMVREELRRSPFTEGTRLQFEDFLRSANADIGRLSA